MRLPAETKMTQVTVGEVRITLIGASTGMMGRMAYMDDVGNTYGSTMYRKFSRETWKLVSLLKESMEKDFVGDIEAGEATPVEDAADSNAFDEDAFVFGQQPE